MGTGRSFGWLSRKHRDPAHPVRIQVTYRGDSIVQAVRADFGPRLRRALGTDVSVGSVEYLQGNEYAFAVEDVGDMMDDLGRKGVSFVDDAPMSNQFPFVDYAGREFNDEIKFTFSHPGSILGILFEFIQYPKDYATP